MSSENLRRKLKYLIDRASKGFGSNDIRVLKYHMDVTISRDIWDIAIDEPIKIIDALEALFGSEKAALNILKQLFYNALIDLEYTEVYVNEIVESIRNNDSKKFRRLISELFELYHKSR